MSPPAVPLLLVAACALDDPIELGQVDWRRDHDRAFAEARRAERPVLLLFQEIPG